MAGFCRIVLLFSLFNLVLCDSCEPNQGTEGIYDCVRIPNYDGYQWAICLSNQALETQTSRKMNCKGSLFCWLPCAQSIYPNSNREHIPKECKCDPDENERRKRSLLAKGSESKVNIPTACYVPTWKNSCNWYSKCLEAHSSCEGSDFNYAISYGEAICSIFQRRYNSLTIAGRSWIRSSQKCIQDLMRKAFMPNNTEKCKDIRNLAYEIHSDCYIQKGEFCKLSGSDQLTIYWSIKQLYEHAFSEKFDEGMARFRSCLQNDPKQEQRKFMFYIEKSVNHSVDENTFASRIAEKFNFASHGLDWDVDKAFSIKHKKFYKSQEYQVVQMFLGKRQVKVYKRRKRQSNRHLLKLAREDKLSKLFMDELAASLTYGYRIEDLKLVGIIVEKYNVIECERIVALYVFDPPKTCVLKYLGSLPATPKSIDTKFYLFNKKGERIQLTLTDTSSLEQFDPKEKTFIIIHGFQSNGDAPWILDLRNTLLFKEEDANIIVVDWRGGADLVLLDYRYAAANTQLVGYFLAELIKNLRHVRNAADPYFHVIGHSLGAHVAGFAANVLKDKKLDRITGLDPAGPCFSRRSENGRLDRDDANFVDVIHTDGGIVRDEQGKDMNDLLECVGYPSVEGLFEGLGYLAPMGHVDFYPNQGQLQDGCITSFSFSCSHARAYSLFIRSILIKDYFSAWRCGTLDQCKSGVILDEKARERNWMGYYAENPGCPFNNMYYLETDETTIIWILENLEKLENVKENSEKSKQESEEGFCYLLEKIFHIQCKWPVYKPL